MRVDVKAGLDRHAGLEHGRSHQPPPQQRAPVIRPGCKIFRVEQAVIAGRERVVHHDLNAGLRQPSKLVEISERIEECGGEAIAAAGGFRGLGQPDRLARLESVAKPAIEIHRLVGSGQPLFRKRAIRGAGAGASFGRRAIVMVRENIQALPGCRKQACGRIRLTRHARAKDQDVRRLTLHERTEYPEVASVGRCIIAGCRIARRCDVWLVHEFRGSDTAADRGGIGEQARRLMWRPYAGRVAGARADGERRHDLCSDGAREIDHAAPLLMGQHAVESSRRRRWRRVGIRKIGRVRPGSADT